MEVFIKKSKPKESIVFQTYWEFAAKRQEIFFHRFYSNDNLFIDEIFQKYKFTNAYRASDRVSQYLIKNIIYKGSQKPTEVLFRILLFKTFNRISTWEILSKELGEISFSKFKFEEYDNILSSLLNQGVSIYSGAYIMTSGKNFSGFSKKHKNHLKLIEFMLKDNLAQKIENSKTMEEVFKVLLQYPTIGNFLAYQYTIDINYSNITSFNEMDFVVPGPGAKDGIQKCFVNLGQYSDSDIIRYMTDMQELEFERFNLKFQNLWGRKLQLIDCQNLFCEVDKYSRIAHPEVIGISGRSRIKQKYKKTNTPIEYWYPPKWKINEKISIDGRKKE